MKPWYKTWWGIIIIIILTLILIFLVAFSFYIYNSVKVIKGGSATAKLSGKTYQAADDDHYWLGSANGKITIVEFGDFACPHCEEAFSTVRQIGLKYKNDIKLIWRDYPVVADYSAILALAGRCAGEQGLFWPMYDKLFQNQGVSTVKELNELANQIGADTTRFNNCLTQEKYLTKIQKDLSDGQSFGISGTPVFFINGYKVEGAIPYDTFVKIIEELKK